MTHTIEFISTHPLVAFCVMSIHLGISLALYEFQLPIIVMQLFQIFAWVITITVGAITIYNFCRNKDKKNK